MLFDYSSLRNSFPKWPATLFWTWKYGYYSRPHQACLLCTHTLLDMLVHLLLRFTKVKHIPLHPGRGASLHDKGHNVLNTSPQPPELVNFIKHPRHIQDRASKGSPLRKRTSQSFKVTSDLESVLLWPEGVSVQSSL